MRRSLPTLSSHLNRINFHGELQTSIKPVAVPVHRRMFSKQQSLPRLPVPPLKQTMDLYLRMVKPFLDPSIYAEAVRDADEFLNRSEQGPRLHQSLVDRSKRTENWLSEWWLYYAYLDCRLPVVVNVNPGVRFPEQKFASDAEWIEYAGKLVWSALDFKILVDTETLPVDKLGGQPLCMVQYHSCFNSCRIPGEKSDALVSFPPNKPNPPGHIVVIFKNRFFKVTVYDVVQKRQHSLPSIVAQLKNIVETTEEFGPGVGLLTTNDRDSWFNSHKRLETFRTNQTSFEAIRSSIFALCLDQPVMDQDEVISADKAAKNALHGGGFRSNSGNRYFDKTIQFIVSRDGATGMNYEHAPVEGPPIVSIVDHAFKKMASLPVDGQENIGASGEFQPPSELQFNVDATVEADIQQAATRLDVAVEDLQCTARTFQDFGKNVPKQAKMSPDAFIQVAFQLAHFKLHNRHAPTYESGSLRKFQLGRTETIRSCSPETDIFCRSMVDQLSSTEDRLSALRAAVAAHRRYTDLAVNGNAFDRHLLGLKLSAVETGSDLPPLLKGSAYQTAMHIQLSTSQVPCRVAASMLFGPVVADGYGICYNPQEDAIHLVCTSYKSCDATDCNRLADQVEESLREMAEMLQHQARL